MFENEVKKRHLERVKYMFDKVNAEAKKSTLSNNITYSIQQDSNGNKYVNIDTDQNIFIW